MSKYKIAGIILSQDLERKTKESQTILLPEELDHFNVLISKFEEIECEPIIVIAGQEPYYICKKVGADSFYCHNSPEPELGELGALRFALEQLPDEVFGFLLAFLEDQKIKLETLRSIYSMAQQFPDKIIVPQFHGHNGRPVYFSRRFFEHLLQSAKTDLPFSLLEDYLLDIKFLPVNDETILDDEIFLDFDEPIN